MDLVVPVCLGLALAAAAGLRAFLPFFLLGVLARFGQVELGDAFSGLADTPVLIGLGVAVAVELVADKIPALDNLLDLIGGPVRTLAGMAAFAAVLGDAPTWAQALGGVVGGGGAAATTHSTKSLLRLGSSAVTGGVANPVLSLLEDVVSIAVTVLSVLFAVVAVITGVAVVVGVGLALRRLVRWIRGGEGDASGTKKGEASDLSLE